MKQGFVKAASATPAIRVADPVYNAQVICEQMEEAVSMEQQSWCFRNCVSPGTPVGIFLQELLLEKAKEALLTITAQTGKMDAVILVGTSDRERRPVIQCCGGIVPGRYPGNDPEEKHPFLRRIL